VISEKSFLRKAELLKKFIKMGGKGVTPPKPTKKGVWGDKSPWR